MFGEEAYIAPPSVSISASEYRLRQQTISEQLNEDDLLIIVCNPESARSGDVEYPYRNNSDMLYLCGWKDPDSVMITRHSKDGWKTELFVQPRDVLMEIWHGRRPGVEGAMESWPIDEAHGIDELQERLAAMLDECSRVLHRTGFNSMVDSMVNSAFESKSRARQLLGKGPISIEDPSGRIAEMRLRKSPAEIELMRHASRVSSRAHVESMRSAKPGVGEWQLQAIIEGCFMWNGQSWAYPSIVGYGENATILHYHANNAVCDGDGIVLIDAGSEYEGYAADITRSWPVSGSFSESQKAIYQIVLDAQKAAIAACVVGAAYNEPHITARRVLAEGLIKLGIIEQSLDEALAEDGELNKWYMHNTGHWIGLDVHDVGIYRPDGEPRILEEGMVMTVEPGLYFGAWRPDVEVDEEWAGIGIRIEDDVLVTAQGPEVLTADCPKEISELEALIGSAD